MSRVEFGAVRLIEQADGSLRLRQGVYLDGELATTCGRLIPAEYLTDRVVGACEQSFATAERLLREGHRCSRSEAMPAAVMDALEAEAAFA